jgi:hypothetical protein
MIAINRNPKLATRNNRAAVRATFSPKTDDPTNLSDSPQELRFGTSIARHSKQI